MPAIPLAPALFLVELKVADWAGAVRWYEKTLGLALVLRDDERGFALFAAGPARVGLKWAPTKEPSGKPFRLIFHVDDLDVMVVRLRARGASVSSPAENQQEGYREVRLTDPEGTPISLFEWFRVDSASGRPA
jgi:predicted enzyme related to lactoylglutathione lyase